MRGEIVDHRKILPPFLILHGKVGSATIAVMDEEHLKKLAESLGNAQETLIRMDKRIESLATKNDLKEVELKIARLEGEDEAIKAEVKGLSDTLTAKIDGSHEALMAKMEGFHKEVLAKIEGSNREIRAELKGKIGWLGALSIIGTLAILIPAVLWLLQTFLK